MLALLGVVPGVPLRAQGVDTAWSWGTQCASPIRIGLRLSLDRKEIHRATLPICQVGRRAEPGRIAVRFTSPRALVWYGYRSDEGTAARDPGDTTAANTPFEFELWQAGSALNGVVLGVSASAPDGLHMNTLHHVAPGEQRLTTLAPGLVLETWPERTPTRRRGAARQ